MPFIRSHWTMAIILLAVCCIAGMWFYGSLEGRMLNRLLIVTVLLTAFWLYVRRRPGGPIRMEGAFVVWEEVGGAVHRVRLADLRRVIVQQEIDNALIGRTRLDLKLFTADGIHKVPVTYPAEFAAFLAKLEPLLAARDVNVLHVDVRGRIAKSSREERQ